RTASGGGAGRDEGERWPDDRHVALWRYAWAGQPQAQREDARLIVDWREALSQALRLRDVAESIGAKFVQAPLAPRESKRDQKQLRFDQQLPSGLEDLLVGLRSR